MIVYAGKQYWNDFNNWDEGVFQDANRPRDDYKFQLRPWVNTKRNDLRTANSGIAAQGTFYWAKLQDWQQYITDANSNWLFNTAYLRNSYTAADIPWVINAEYVAPQMKAVIVGRPYVNTSDWDVVIGKSWIYAITVQAEFIAPASYASKTTSTTFSSSSAFYKFYVAMMLNWQPHMYTQARGCGGLDTHSLVYVGWMDTWDRLNIGFLHTYTTDPFSVITTINLYRLS